jgi:beta-glucosidase
LDSADDVQRFADIARQEYRAVGIHEALSPQADLATEPRWPRMTGTFGSSPERVARLVKAYVLGFQHGAAGPDRAGVMCVVKHWVGYGAAPEGLDAHNYYGRSVRLTDEELQLHAAAFRGAFAANVGGVMPAYVIVQGPNLAGGALEPVGVGFSPQLITKFLRGQFGFRGVVLSDWAITQDCGPRCRNPSSPQTLADIGMPWGVEDSSQVERIERGIAAGIDQFGGTERPDLIVQVVRAKHISQARVDAAVRRIMATKFELGLFEAPFVDVERARERVGNPEFQHRADDMQRRAQVLLEDQHAMLPVKAAPRVYVYGLSPDVVRSYGFEIVDRPELGDWALFRLNTPHELLHPNHFFGQRQHEGRLDFRDGDPDYKALEAAAARVPVIVSVYLDRPALLANIRDKAAVLLANFGASDEALLDVITGRARAEGRLPFELPSSDAAVRRQNPARPDDSMAPLFPVGSGIVQRP